tara:strand:+ start:3100 stop:5160 length:2061 start_codon:yes stop_codon:yes gene_type:complete
MLSRWVDSDASKYVQDYAAQGFSENLALCVYSTRLLGQEQKLVLHGGGNTSVKDIDYDILGTELDVLRVKGSGWDMASIEPDGLPSVRLSPLKGLMCLDDLSDEDMVNFERTHLLNSQAPTPSIETLSHAFLPHRFINHTHSSAILSLTNQPNGEELCSELFGDAMGLVPYIMPGFRLAKRSSYIFEKNPKIQGLVLLKHGIFTFADTARDAYEYMVEAVTLVENRLNLGQKPVFKSVFSDEAMSQNNVRISDVVPVIRGALNLKNHESGMNKPFVMNFRTSPEILDYVNGDELERYSQAGVATPDHAIRTKNWPMLIPLSGSGQIKVSKRVVSDAVIDFERKYHQYFERHSRSQDRHLKELDPRPRVVLVPGLGLFGVGRTVSDAKIAADIAESTVETITAAESIGIFESVNEADLFDIEYWSLEQAKLKDSEELPLVGHIVLVTGGSGTIGSAISKSFEKEGAVVVRLDVNKSIEDTIVNDSSMFLKCDVTDKKSVRKAFDKVCEKFGGIDIVVSNAGAASSGRIGVVKDELLRESFELNFFAHQTVAQNAVRVMRAQGTGGVLLFNVSKQALSPGLDFGPYGIPKAATLHLVRQYALDHGSEGIRANAVNADRVRGGLLTSEMISDRSKARGVSEKEYMSGNLLGMEVTADDVAQAFVHQALQKMTTAGLSTVDGGNISAAVR